METWGTTNEIAHVARLGAFHKEHAPRGTLQQLEHIEDLLYLYIRTRTQDGAQKTRRPYDLNKALKAAENRLHYTRAKIQKLRDVKAVEALQ